MRQSYSVTPLYSLLMPLLNDLKRLFEAQDMVMSDRQMMVLSADLAEDPAFVVIKEDVIKDIKKNPEKYIRPELLTYVRLLQHELVLMNDMRTLSTPKSHFKNVKKAKEDRVRKQMDLLHDIWEKDAKMDRASFWVRKDDEEVHFQVTDIQAGDELLVSLYEHLEIIGELNKPCQTIDDIHAQDKIKRMRRRPKR